jgi:hypothetical protein
MNRIDFLIPVHFLLYFHAEQKGISNETKSGVTESKTHAEDRCSVIWYYFIEDFSEVWCMITGPVDLNLNALLL